MQFLLSICKHEGVYFQDGLNPRTTKATDNFSDHLFNLAKVFTINFEESLMSYDSEADPKDSHPSIRFVREGDSNAIDFTLLFKPEGMGEYHRYKRQIEEFVIGCDNKKPDIRGVK